MRGRLVSTLLIAALAVAPVAAVADKGGKGQGKHKGDDPDYVIGPPGKGHGRPDAVAPPYAIGAPALATTVVIGSDERRIITDYFRVNPYAVAPLPPGIAKQVARGKPLPPGIAKKYPPGPLLGRLPPRPGYEWVLVGRDVLLVSLATAVVVDVLRDAF
jgi:hypothetical protein